MKRPHPAGLLLIICCILSILIPVGACAVQPMLRNGGSFVIVLREDGRLVGWGDNRMGQLGTSSIKVHTRPIYVADDINGSELKDIQCGNLNTLFLMNDGRVLTCGSYQRGTQGLGPLNTIVKKPTEIPTLHQITQIACGFGHNAALDEDGHVWTWGRNDYGQLGIGSKQGKDTPVMLDLENITSIACGGKFTLAQDADGVLYGWGANTHRVLQDSGKESILSPIVLTGLEGLSVTAFAGGSDMAFWLDDEGVLWSRGRNELKQCGSQDAAWKVSPQLTRVDIPEKVVNIIGYSSVPIALTENGNAYIWGCTTNGQIGDGTAPGSAFPTAGWNQEDCVQVAAGSIFTSLMTADGKVYTTGYNSYGQLGKGDKRETSSWTWTGVIVSQTGDPTEEALKALSLE